MPGPRLDPLETDQTLPDKTEVVIIGGGIVGASTALMLAERGIPAVLCEKGVLGGEQSSRNWGWVRVMGRDRREIPLAIEALKIWDGIDARIGGETGFRRAGILYISETEEDITNRDRWLALARAHGLDTRQIGPTETAALMPGATARYRGAMLTASDGRAEPQKAVPAIAAGARAKGATILAGCAVRGVELSGGRVSGVVTEKGRIACSTVVVAGGAWSRLLLKGLGITLPQLKVRNSVLRTGPVDGGPKGAGATSTYAYRKRLDGGYTIADGAANLHALVPDSIRFLRLFGPARKAEGDSVQIGLTRRSFEELFEIRAVPLDRPGVFERHRILDPKPDEASALKALKAAQEAFPIFRGTAPAQIWAGLIDVTPDAVPVISTVDSVPGLVISTGYSGHGFGIGPGAGQLTADLATGDAPIVDPAPFRLSRFFDGSPLELAPPV
ncbi:D-amino-acid oxidase [Xaviernesmea oryzae]|uniref:D-amino-acid oxidase n=1 Tax=Xaviernesmea oryzae TaxID=464029 RepID=A0A1Q9AZ13_9HYPH|nr:FAD-binding oxidoreductase [Xaviernesmea oryzae]OLP60943.1 D-amino-acid oxidase [Xaviernesmea oryzae]SEL20750.1 Glycine/D-amino acid oxidase [Xaviernesmea oryzae]